MTRLNSKQNSEGRIQFWTVFAVFDIFSKGYINGRNWPKTRLSDHTRFGIYKPGVLVASSALASVSDSIIVPTVTSLEEK